MLKKIYLTIISTYFVFQYLKTVKYHSHSKNGDTSQYEIEYSIFVQPKIQIKSE